jgi:hypothetical protein
LCKVVAAGAAAASGGIVAPALTYIKLLTTG